MILKTFLKVNSTECLRRSDGTNSMGLTAPSSFSMKGSKHFAYESEKTIWSIVCRFFSTATSPELLFGQVVGLEVTKSSSSKVSVTKSSSSKVSVGSVLKRNLA
jgi:hypothetical protein